jgi:hypothetical protein
VEGVPGAGIDHDLDVGVVVLEQSPMATSNSPAARPSVSVLMAWASTGSAARA